MLCYACKRITFFLYVIVRSFILQLKVVGLGTRDHVASSPTLFYLLIMRHRTETQSFRKDRHVSRFTSSPSSTVLKQAAYQLVKPISRCRYERKVKANHSFFDLTTVSQRKLLFDPAQISQTVRVLDLQTTDLTIYLVCSLHSSKKAFCDRHPLISDRPLMMIAFKTA